MLRSSKENRLRISAGRLSIIEVCSIRKRMSLVLQDRWAIVLDFWWAQEHALFEPLAFRRLMSWRTLSERS
jgi:hypothetical protein